MRPAYPPPVWRPASRRRGFCALCLVEALVSFTVTARRIIVALVPGLLLAAPPPGVAHAGPHHAIPPAGRTTASSLVADRPVAGGPAADRAPASRLAANRPPTANRTVAADRTVADRASAAE